MAIPCSCCTSNLRASAAGIEFATNTADAYWLDERLGSVKVLVLGCYAGEARADWFARVETVVTLREEMAPRECPAICGGVLGGDWRRGRGSGGGASGDGRV